MFGNKVGVGTPLLTSSDFVESVAFEKLTGSASCVLDFVASPNLSIVNGFVRKPFSSENAVS